MPLSPPISQMLPCPARPRRSAASSRRARRAPYKPRRLQKTLADGDGFLRQIGLFERLTQRADHGLGVLVAFREFAQQAADNLRQAEPQRAVSRHQNGARADRARRQDLADQRLVLSVGKGCRPANSS